MYCVNCGESNRSNARFCVSCGRRLTQKNKSAVIDGQIHIDDIFVEEKASARRKPAEGKRVAPLKENPTQPSRKSIFDDDDEAPVVKKPSKPKQQTPSRLLYDEPKAKPKKPRESASEPKLKMPEKKPTQKKPRESVSEPKLKMPESRPTQKKPRENASEPKLKMPEKKPAQRKPHENVSEPKIRMPEKKPRPSASERRPIAEKHENDFKVKPKKPRSDASRRTSTSENHTKAKPVKPKVEYAEPKVKLPPRKPASADTRRRSAQKPQPAKRPDARRTSRPAPIKTGRGGARMSDAKRRAANARRRAVYSYDERETFTEKHLRSIIAMCLLVAFICGFLAWGNLTESGLRTFAQFGVGGTQGYILLGDDCMEYGNYPRAVEHYYNALSRESSYEAAIKLARAYAKTGDADREAGALLYCLDKYPTETEAKERLTALYPDPSTRPTKVTEALNAARR